MAKQKILYIVHPDSILEQSANISHVKPYIDKVDKAISKFSGQVIVSKLNQSYYHPSESEPEEKKKGADYVADFMKKIKSNSKVSVISEDRAKNLLGKGAMAKMIDDLFLKEELDEIVLGGVFTCDHTEMCVDSTYKALSKEYGKNHVRIDPNLTLKTGMVFKQSHRVVLSYLKLRGSNLKSFNELSER